MTSRSRSTRAKGVVGDVMDLVTRRVVRDIDAERQRLALQRTAAYVDAFMPRAESVRCKTAYEGKFRVLDMALEAAPAEGLVLEFGVASGQTLRHIVGVRPEAQGFDSFEGLPEHWRSGVEAGHFAQSVPDVDGARLHIGWFSETLPEFFAVNTGPIAFAHLDADLYSSTATILEYARGGIVPGTILVFDEYFNVIGWEDHEHLAFMEFIEASGLSFEYVAYNSLGEQVMVRMVESS